MMDTSQLQWRKSTRSANGSECVEVATVVGASDAGALAPSLVLLRDSKHPSGPILTFASVQWRAFIGGVKDGRFGGMSH
jgi:hypothetical protein